MDYIKKNYPIFLICLGAIIFYAPYISKQFMGDDWLWLANAKLALDDPAIFFQRPMYGYFRPFNMIVVSLWLTIFGTNAPIFSIISIILHAVNIWLFWKVIILYSDDSRLAIVSSLFFAFYFLNASAIEWISVGHDLWVIFFALLFSIFIRKFHNIPNLINFLPLILSAIAASFFKESGVVTVGIFFFYFILNKTNPFNKKYYLFSLLIIAAFLLYMITYFQTRVVADDKDVSLGIGTITNVWYFTTYLIFPITKRVINFFPEQAIFLLKIFKILLTLIYPILLSFIFIKSTKAVRFFIGWMVMFLSTTSVFGWGISLFDLYPERTISRFMYCAIPGLSIIIGWLIIKLSSFQFSKILLKKYISIPILLIFIIINWTVVKKISPLYFRHQEFSNTIISNFGNMQNKWEEIRNLIIYYDETDNISAVLEAEKHLEAIIFVKFNKAIKIDAQKRDTILSDYTNYNNGTLCIVWDNHNQKFILPQNTTQSINNFGTE